MTDENKRKPQTVTDAFEASPEPPERGKPKKNPEPTPAPSSRPRGGRHPAATDDVEPTD